MLTSGSMVLARFNNANDARMALAAMQHYRFTEKNSIGRPQPFAAYFLSSGQAPRGLFLGVRAEPFKPDMLSLAQVDNRTAIVYKGQPLYGPATKLTMLN